MTTKETLEQILGELELLKMFPGTDTTTIDAAKAIVKLYLPTE